MNAFATNRMVAVTLFAFSASAWGKPKAEINVEVVSIAIALANSPNYHPPVADSSTTVCTPTGEKCTTTTVRGHPASVDNLAFYSQFIYAIMPGERHVTLQYQGFKLIYPPQPGKYSAETDGGKVLFLHVHFPDSGNPNGDKPGTLKYRIVGTW